MDFRRGPLGFVNARLLGSWWAVLVVLLALACGLLLPMLLTGGWQGMQTWSDYLLSYGMVGGLPVATGAVLGDLIGFLTYGAVVVMLSLVLLACVKGIWPALWQTLLVAAAVLPLLLASC